MRNASRRPLMDIKASGVEPGHRQPNGVQTTGRDYRALSEVEFGIRRTNDVEIAVRDGVTLLADLFRPDAEGRFPALLSFSCYPTPDPGCRRADRLRRGRRVGLPRQLQHGGQVQIHRTSSESR